MKIVFSLNISKSISVIDITRSTTLHNKLQKRPKKQIYLCLENLSNLIGIVVLENTGKINSNTLSGLCTTIILFMLRNNQQHLFG
mmetsp:Transcript_28919/g.35271  ORF Transcript_28919/g.35271 Transcript_28919/m.35271 type:complete len:85 (+) Transcript_28919:2-256(+)